MLRGMKSMFGYAIEARDGRLGKVEDFYFDDVAWRVRYLVAETGGWLTRKDVLISPAALDTPRPDEKSFPVKLTRDQVRNSPEVDSDLPVSRQMEESIGSYYGWPAYWSLEALPAAASPEMAAIPLTLAGGPPGDPHLRSGRELIGYKVRAQEVEAGSVEDFIVDDDDWTIRYIIVRVDVGGVDRDVVLNPWWAREFEWNRRVIHFDLTTRQICSSPEFDSATLDRKYEQEIHEYYDRPAYWKNKR